MKSREVPSSGQEATSEVARAYLDLKRQYDDLVSRSLAGIFRSTVDGRFLECNDAMAHILGYADRDALMRHQAVDLYYSEAERNRFLDTLFRERRLTNFEIVLKHRSGRPVYVLENVFVDELEDRNPTIQGTLIDITAMRHAQVEQASLMSSYRSVVEHIRDGLLVVSGGVIRYANPAAEGMMGRRLVGERMDGIFLLPFRADVQELMERSARTPVERPIAVRLQNEGEQEVLLFATAVHHEGAVAMQLTLQDQCAQQVLLEERLRLRMAEDVNQVLRDEIMQHRRTQEELRRSRKFLSSLVNSSLDMIMAADPEGRVTVYNPAASLRFGWEPEEILGLNTRFLYADPEQYQAIQQQLERHGVYTGEVLNRTKEGEVFTSFLAASRLYDEDGEFLGAMGVSRDITRMKRDQEALRASEERYRDLFENATDLIQSVDVEGRFRYVNNAWKQVLGYSDEEVAAMSFMDIIHPDEQEHCKDLFERIMRGEEVEELRTAFVAKDGRRVDVEGTTNLRRVDGQPQATRSIFRDVTGVLAARRRVQEHEAKWKALFESSEHMFWTVDRDLKLTSHNQAYGDVVERLYGTRPEINTDPAKPRKLFAPRSYHDFWAAKYAEAFAGRPVQFETDITDHLGNRVSNEIFLSPIFGPDGVVTEVFGVGHEITEQKRAEDLVRENSARIQAIFDNAANMMVWTMDEEFRITSCNGFFCQSALEDFGVELGVGMVFNIEPAERTSGRDMGQLLERYRAAFRGKPQQFEVELVDKSGRTIWVENFINPIRIDGKVREVSGLAYHITERKEAQRELLRSLAEKEVLLKEVHHRVKNNLQIISSIMNLQSAYVSDDDDRLKDLLHHSRDRICSMSLIHESLYQHKDFSALDLGAYIDGLARNLMMSYSLSGKVDLRLDLAPTSLVLDQAIPCGLILNELISNALKHAFPTDANGSVSIGLRCDEDRVELTVADDGRGLPAGFDPHRQGNLGLELVRTLVDQLDGRLEVRSGQGVTYFLTFERIKHSGNGADERPRGGG
jgi:PAS domain S-box-containing protein